MNASKVMCMLAIGFIVVFSILLPFRTVADDSVVSLTQKEKQWLLDNPALKLGVGIAFPPFMWVENKGGENEFKGIVSDYVDLIAERLGIELQVVYNIPFNEALEQGKKGEIDFFPCLSQTPERSEFLLFTKPYLIYPMVIITREDAPLVGGLNDLTGKRFAIVKHLVVYSKIQNDYPDLNLDFVFTQKVDENLEAISLGRADACIINLAAASYYIHKKGITNLKVAAPVDFKGVYLAMGVRKELAEFRGILEKTLASISREEKDEISQRWIQVKFDPGFNLKKIAAWTLGSLSIFLGILFLFFSWNRRLKNEIQERQTTEISLRESERKLSTLIGNLPGMAYRCLNDPDWTMLFLSDGCTELTGYHPQEILSSLTISYNGIIHPEDREYVRSKVEMAIKTQDNFMLEYRIVTKNGQVKWVWEKGVFLEEYHNGVQILEGFINDISDRKQARQNQDNLLTLFNNAEKIGKTGSWSIDFVAGETKMSAGDYDIHGLPHDVPVSFETHLKCVYENDRQEHKEIFEENLASPGEEFRQEYRIALPDGEIRSIQADYHIDRDSDGRPLKAWGTDKDVTEQKNIEAQIQQAQKMESIGNLAGGIAHEFNNILSIIIGNNELVMEDLPNWSLAHKSAEEIRIAGLRARDVVKQLLTFSRQDNAVQKKLDLRKVIEESLRLIRSTIPANIEIQKTFEPGDYVILGNETQMNQMLINLCSNAADAIANNPGTLYLNLSNEQVLTEKQFGDNSFKPGRYIRFVFSDTGAGMDPNILNKIFEPYFTTKEVGKGSGIGLAVVHGIVQRHRGGIKAESQPGKGTRFTIWFPAATGERKNETGDEVDIIGGNESILYVDDEPSITKLSKYHLESKGYKVTAMEDPVAALELFEENADQFDLVISDMAMPNMTGDRLVSKVLEIRPDVPCIINTGYSEKFSEKDAENLGVKAFLMKPIDKKQLVVTVRKILDE